MRYEGKSFKFQTDAVFWSVFWTTETWQHLNDATVLFAYWIMIGLYCTFCGKFYFCPSWKENKSMTNVLKENSLNSRAQTEKWTMQNFASFCLFSFFLSILPPSPFLFLFLSQTSSVVAKVSVWGRFKFSAAFQGQFVILTGANQNTGSRSSLKSYGPSLCSCRTQIKFWIWCSNPSKHN